MTTLTIGLLVAALAVAILLAYVASRPATFRIERSERIQAEAPAVFARVNNLRSFNSWNPFNEGDASMKIAYIGPETGPGAAFKWDSNGKGGTGRITIVDAAAPSKVDMRLEFLKPFATTNDVRFSLAGEGTTTRITWAMTGRTRFPQRLACLFFNMDKMVGGEFARGLANLKAQLEH